MTASVFVAASVFVTAKRRRRRAAPTEVVGRRRRRLYERGVGRVLGGWVAIGREGIWDFFNIFFKILFNLNCSIWTDGPDRLAGGLI